MSEEVRKPWGTRVDEETKAFFDKNLETIAEIEGFTGKSWRFDSIYHAFRIVGDYYSRGGQEKEIPGAIPNLERRIPCSYFHRDYGRNKWICTAYMFERKVIKVLGIIGEEDELVLIKCEDCKQKERELENKKIRALLKGDTLDTIKDIVKKFIKIKRGGFDDVCFMCLAGLFEGRFAFSEDSVNLQCENLDMAYVNIDKVCRQTINPSTRVPPCEYFLEAVHAANLDKVEAIKKLTEVEIFETACPAYGTPECPGVPQCTEDLVALANMKKYCPDRYSPETDIPLLEELEESPE